MDQSRKPQSGRKALDNEIRVAEEKEIRMENAGGSSTGSSKNTRTSAGMLWSVYEYKGWIEERTGSIYDFATS